MYEGSWLPVWLRVCTCVNVDPTDWIWLRVLVAVAVRLAAWLAVELRDCVMEGVRVAVWERDADCVCVGEICESKHSPVVACLKRPRASTVMFCVRREDE